MTQATQRLVGHGAVVSFFGLLAGFGLTMSLIGGFEIFPGTILSFEVPGDDRAWARAHTGGLMNGLLVFVGALLIDRLHLAGPYHWMFAGTGYANTVFYWAALFAPNHAISFGDNPLGESNLAGVIGFAPAFVFAFVMTAAMVMLARHAFQRG